MKVSTLSARELMGSRGRLSLHSKRENGRQEKLKKGTVDKWRKTDTTNFKNNLSQKKDNKQNRIAGVIREKTKRKKFHCDDN